MRCEDASKNEWNDFDEIRQSLKFHSAWQLCDHYQLHRKHWVTMGRLWKRCLVSRESNFDRTALVALSESNAKGLSHFFFCRISAVVREFFSFDRRNVLISTRLIDELCSWIQVREGIEMWTSGAYLLGKKNGTSALKFESNSDWKVAIFRTSAFFET